MSCRRQLEDGSGGGRRAEKDEDWDEGWSAGEVEEEEESEMEEGVRKPYRRHKWILVAACSGIELKEAYKNFEGIMVDDFSIGGGISRSQWPEPGEKKIGQFSFKLVNRYYYYFKFILAYGKDFLFRICI